MGSEEEKNSVPSLDDKSDYRLWRVRVEALCDSKDLEEFLIKNPYDQTTEKYLKIEGVMKKASNMTVRSLTIKVLRVVLQAIGKLCQMLRKLDGRYDSKCTSNKICKTT